MDEVKLPELPEPGFLASHWTRQQFKSYAPDEMREYARMAVLAERERLALEWERIHGFDKHGVAAFIRDGKVKGYRSDNG